MLPLAASPLLRAHPETAHPHVDVPVVVVVVGAVMVVALLATLVPAARRAPTSYAVPPTASWTGTLTVAQRLVRAVAVLLLVTAVAAGRVGVDDELENLAPALVVGAGWPALVLGSLVLGTLWRWLDPWDALARVVAPRDTSAPPDHVWPAVLLALPWLWFLAAWPRPLDPRSVGTALTAYTVVTLAGCLALGRARWLGSAEPVGLLLSWTGLLPTRHLAGWVPPRGAGALLGTVAGGSLFGAVRRTGAWSEVAARPDALLWSTSALLGSCLAGALVFSVVGRGTTEQRAVVVRTAVPVVAGVVLAVALARNRFTTSLQLLPGLLGDPLGRGWDLLGAPMEGLDPAPFGAAGLVALQLAVAVVGHALAAATAPRTLVGDERLPAIAVLAVSTAVSVTALSLH